MLPTLPQALELYEKATAETDKLNLKQGLAKGVSRHHYQSVAFVAATIAPAAGLEIEKAYILGLLHDFGEYIEKTVANTFHGTAGYDEMLKLGFDEIAQVCLSHSFFDADFTPQDFPAYNSAQIVRAAKLLKQKDFDDYDRLIHLADMMVISDKISTIEDRMAMISAKYHLSPELSEKKYQQAMNLKTYFDKLCARNIYSFFDL